jgi:hypothetical protein
MPFDGASPSSRGEAVARAALRAPGRPRPFRKGAAAAIGFFFGIA